MLLSRAEFHLSKGADMSTCDLLIVGRNQLLYLEKLKKHGITVRSVTRLSEKKIILRIAANDVDKAVELAGKTWYNKIIRYHGVLRIWGLIKSNVLMIVTALLLTVSLVFLDNVIFEIDYSGVPISHVNTARQIMKSQGISPFTLFGNVSDSQLKATAASYGFSFFEVEKIGFKLKVSAKTNGDKHSTVQSYDKIIAPYTCKIVSIVVFSGNALKAAGDNVYIGETIVDGKAYINEQEYTVKAIAQILVERTFIEEFQTTSSSEQTINECVAKARLQVLGDDCTWSSSVTPVGDGFIIKVELKVLCLIDGG